jgi:hypothetical protein
MRGGQPGKRQAATPESTKYVSASIIMNLQTGSKLPARKNMNPFNLVKKN